MLLLIATAGFSGCGSGGERSQQEDAALTYLSCQYSARSTQAARACVLHTDADDVAASDSNAARWARGELSKCEADAGPLCGVRQRWEIKGALALIGSEVNPRPAFEVFR